MTTLAADTIVTGYGKQEIVHGVSLTAEAGKITWAGRRETMVTTGMVFVFVTLAAIFFLLVDQAISAVVQFLLRLI